MKPWKSWATSIPFLILAPACGPAPAESPVESSADVVRAVFTGADAEWIDMTYVLDENTIFWPTARPFELEVVSAGFTDGGYYYGANNFSPAEHGGTHIDAPIHFAEARQTVDEIPLDHLVGPAIVLDASRAAEANPDYLIGVSDLEAWEAEHGAIPDGSILLLRTGWGARWPDRGRYLGTTKTGEEAVAELHFPGLDPAAASWLVENRNIDAIGIDTASIDYGQSVLFETHRILLGENIPAFENVASLDRLPETGSYVLGLPVKIAGGTGSPLRLVSVIPR
jgi:kynurenine formamidase